MAEYKTEYDAIKVSAEPSKGGHSVLVKFERHLSGGSIASESVTYRLSVPSASALVRLVVDAIHEADARRHPDER